MDEPNELDYKVIEKYFHLENDIQNIVNVYNKCKTLFDS